MPITAGQVGRLHTIDLLIEPLGGAAIDLLSDLQHRGFDMKYSPYLRDILIEQAMHA